MIPGQMKAKCIDYGQNFLTGQATSVLQATGIEIGASNLKDLADAVQDKTMAMVSELQATATKEVTKVGSQIGGMAGSVAGAGLSAMQGAFQSADLVKLAAGELTTYGVQLVSDCSSKIGSMITAFPQKVLSQAADIAGQQAKKELTNLIKEVMGTPAEKRAEEEAKEEKESKVKKAIEWCKKAVKDVNDFKDSTLGKLQEDCEDISALMIQGPDWVNNQVGSAVDSAKSYMGSFVDKQMENVNEFYAKAVENSAQAMATTLTKELVDPTIKKAKEQFNKLGTTKNQTTQKAKAAIQKKLFNLAGKLGISPNV